MALVFLGTGAAGGTPGEGRSGRRESSVLVHAGEHRMLIDVTRDVGDQVADLDRIDAVLVTHAHRDASGGIPALRRWWRAREHGVIPLLAHPATIAAIRDRWARLDHCRLVSAQPGARRRVGPWQVTPIEVPHAAGTATVAWRLDGRASVTYASDVAALTDDLERGAAGSDTLVLDGAMWGRSLFSHLRVDHDLPTACHWDVGDIWLTQIGRSAPPHESFEAAVRALCERAAPAWDGLTIDPGRP